MHKQAIGVFDSGIGGLTILRALRKALPHENFIYFGDTANVPYGGKSKAMVTRLATAVAQFLQTQQVKLIVVACNTASAQALPALSKSLSVPVMGVIAPGAQAAVSATKNHKIAVLPHSIMSTRPSGRVMHRYALISEGLSEAIAETTSTKAVSIPSSRWPGS